MTLNNSGVRNAVKALSAIDFRIVSESRDIPESKYVKEVDFDLKENQSYWKIDERPLWSYVTLLDGVTPQDDPNFILFTRGRARLLVPLEDRKALSTCIRFHVPGKALNRILFRICLIFLSFGFRKIPFTAQLRLPGSMFTPWELNSLPLVYIGTSDNGTKVTLLPSDESCIYKLALDQENVAALANEADALNCPEVRSMAPQVPVLLSKGIHGEVHYICQSYALRDSAAVPSNTQIVDFLFRFLRDSITLVNGLHLGPSHGDFTPWNVMVSGGNVFVFDWEKWNNYRPCLFDSFLYVFSPYALETKPVGSSALMADFSSISVALGKILGLDLSVVREQLEIWVELDCDSILPKKKSELISFINFDEFVL